MTILSFKELLTSLLDLLSILEHYHLKSIDINLLINHQLYCFKL